MTTKQQATQNEERIVWLLPKENYEYLRESVYARCTRNRPVRLNKGLILVGYAVLKPFKSRIYLRRYWWLKPYDRWEGNSHPDMYPPDDAPAEAVDPNSIVAGRESEPYEK